MLSQLIELVRERCSRDRQNNVQLAKYAKKIANHFVNLTEDEQFTFLFELEQRKEMLFAQCDPDIIEMNQKALQDCLAEVEYLRVLYLNPELTGPDKIFEPSFNHLETLLIKIKAYV